MDHLQHLDYSPGLNTWSTKEMYGSHWGITDLYPEIRRDINELLIGDRPFKVRWGSKKQLWSGSIERLEDGELEVGAIASCDEGFDLITDAWWQAYRNEDYPDGEQMEEIADEAYGCDILLDDPTFCEFARMPASSTLDEVLEKLSDLMDEAEKASSANFDRLVDVVREWAARQEAPF